MSIKPEDAPPGSWELDSDHHERPMPPFLAEDFPGIYTRQFRRWMRDYGTVVDTIECKIIDDFVYMCVRPVGAPPEPKGEPPGVVLWLLMRLVPELRRREKLAQQLFEKKLWRDEAARFVNEAHPRCQEACNRLKSVDVTVLSDQELSAHLDQCREVLQLTLETHFSINGAHMLPVGDFLHHVKEWTGAPPSERMAALRGASIASRGAEPQLVEAARAVSASPEMLERLRADAAAEAILNQLRSNEHVGSWLSFAENTNVSGHSLGDVSGADLAEVLLKTLRRAVSEGRQESNHQGRDAEAAASQLRARVPEEHRDEFDELLADARLTYGLRDLRKEGEAICLTRRAIDEVGKRLVCSGRMTMPEHARALTRQQLQQLLADVGPSREETAALFERFHGRTVADVPALIGPVPGQPPQSRLMPPGLRRTTDALMAYLEVMKEGELSESQLKVGVHDGGKIVQGQGASEGVVRGRARVVDSPRDFSRLGEGDILVARMTTPHYNVVLPLLGGVVTDRGGILSHPAIVAREFGIPGVVGTKVATKVIPDGAMIEVNGASGTVQVVA